MEFIARVFGWAGIILLLLWGAIEVVNFAHRPVHAQQIHIPFIEPPSIYDCNSVSFTKEICRAYDPATKRHFIVIFYNAQDASIVPDDY